MAEPAPWEKYKAAADGPWSKYATAKPAEEGPGILERMWQGMVGKDVSRAGRFGMGLADPVYGGAQLGVRGVLDPPPIAFTEAQAEAFDPQRQADAVGAVDKAVREREQSYEAGRLKAEGPKGRTVYNTEGTGSETVEGLATDWMRMLGTATSTAPMAVAGGVAAAPATVPGRIALSAGIGAGTGATEPVAEGNFVAEKAKQIGLGAAGGMVGGALGEVGGKAIASAIAGNNPQAMESYLIGKFRQVVKPGIRGRLSAPKLEAEDRHILTAMDNIIDNKANLKLTDPIRGEVAGQTPKTLQQFSEAIDQGKTATFQKYDAMAKSAEETTAAAPNRHLAEFTKASKGTAAAERAVADAERSVTLATAKQQRAGNNVYMSSAANRERQQAQRQLEKAQSALERSQAAKSSARTKAYSVRVDLGDAAQQLRSGASSPFIADLHPEVATKLNRLAGRMEREKTYTLSETQDLIKDLNKDLKGFYNNGQGSVGDKLAPVARDLRQKLDEAVTGATSKGYQALREQYGALASIEKDVAAAVRREASKISGGLTDRFFSTLTAAEIFHGIYDPTALIRAAGLRSAQEVMRRIHDPNRAISRMFEIRERTRTIGRASSIGTAASNAMSYSWAPAAAAGGAAMQDRKPVRRDNMHTVAPPPAP